MDDFGDEDLTGVIMKTILFISVVFILFILSCNDNPTKSGDKPLALALTVTDINDNPINGVNFHYIFYIGEDVVNRNAVIEYSLSATDTVTLNIYDPFKRLVATPLDQRVMLAGLYRIFFNGDTLTNGIYRYRFTRSTVSDSGKFLLRTDDSALLKTLPALAQTDQNGQLNLNYSILGIGETFEIYGNTITPLQVTVSDSITILLFKSGYHDYTGGIQLHTNTITEKTIKLTSDL